MKILIIMPILITFLFLSCFFTRAKDYAGILGELYVQNVKTIKLPEECVNKIVNKFEDSLKIKAYHISSIMSSGFKKAIIFDDVEKNYIKDDMRYTGTEYLIIVNDNCEVIKTHNYKYP